MARNNLRWAMGLWVLIHAGLLSAAPLVVETDPLTPEQQKALFHLPPGFEIQLILSEPLIGQPMNLSFDAAGRLYITSSLEYPYPAKGDGVEPREEKTILPCGSCRWLCANVLGSNCRIRPTQKPLLRFRQHR